MLESSIDFRGQRALNEELLQHFGYELKSPGIIVFSVTSSMTYIMTERKGVEVTVV